MGLSVWVLQCEAGRVRDEFECMGATVLGWESEGWISGCMGATV